MFAEFDASSRLVCYAISTESSCLTWRWKCSDCDPSKRHHCQLTRRSSLF